MNIIFLNGQFLLQENKVGVANYHHSLLKNLNIDYKIGVFNFLKKRYNDTFIKNNFYKDKFVINTFIPKKLKTFLPIELYFGRNDVYICDGWSPITLFSSKKIGIVHDLMSILYPNNYDAITKILLKKYFKSLKKFDKIIVNSISTKNDLNKFFNIDKRKIKVIYPSVNVKKFKKRVESIDKSKLKLNKKYILYIGDMRKNKNLISALRAFKSYLDNNNEEIYFYIAGNKKYQYSNLHKFVEENEISECVKFLGYVSEKEKIALYQNSFSFIFPSYYEGFGIPIIEAMASGTPVITSATSSMKEIAEGASLLVAPDNYEQIRLSLEKLNNKETRRSLIIKGKNRVDKLNKNDPSDILLNIINELKE